MNKPNSDIDVYEMFFTYRGKCHSVVTIERVEKINDGVEVGSKMNPNDLVGHEEVTIKAIAPIYRKELYRSK